MARNYNEWLKQTADTIKHRLKDDWWNFNDRKERQILGRYDAAKKGEPEQRLYMKFHERAVKAIRQERGLLGDTPTDVARRKAVYWDLRQRVDVPSPGNFTVDFVNDPTGVPYVLG